ncbi:hypothetical protein PENSPDRAFT_8115 [Peniophora sp. CONT]|nr:hypothetical protein PENSPDRAFT_8115 [Peniophora sp. CONT]
MFSVSRLAKSYLFSLVLVLSSCSLLARLIQLDCATYAPLTPTGALTSRTRPLRYHDPRSHSREV